VDRHTLLTERAMVAEHREVERKYDIEPGGLLPPLVDADPPLRVTEPVTIHLEAVYFDTPDLRLARRGSTLRRRTGGEDEGWHLKLPAGGIAVPSCECRWIGPRKVFRIRSFARCGRWPVTSRSCRSRSSARIGLNDTCWTRAGAIWP
jgi:CYTH domain-containing protein